MCEKCNNKGYLVINFFDITNKIWAKKVKNCDCPKGQELTEIEKKREQKGYNDNY